MRVPFLEVPVKNGNLGVSHKTHPPVVSKKYDPQAIQMFYNYEATGNLYHAIYDLPVCKAEDQTLIPLLKQVIGCNTLDIGCGDGLLASIFPFNKTMGYTGTDISLGLLQTAHKQYDVPFHTADMHTLPYPDHAFDTITSLYGPFSYSLSPHMLLSEFDRVLAPDGMFLIMPYTLRTKVSIELGGESTAVNPKIQKIFYTTKLAQQTFGEYYDVSVRGLNYFANPFARMLSQQQVGKGKFTPNLCMKLMGTWAQQMQLPYPTIEKDMFIPVVEAWNSLDPRHLTQADLEYALQAEESIAMIVPAEFARHMIVMGKKMANYSL